MLQPEEEADKWLGGAIDIGGAAMQIGGCKAIFVEEPVSELGEDVAEVVGGLAGVVGFRFMVRWWEKAPGESVIHHGSLMLVAKRVQEPFSAQKIRFGAEKGSRPLFAHVGSVSRHGEGHCGQSMCQCVLLTDDALNRPEQN
jgi:hypothetical protein